MPDKLGVYEIEKSGFTFIALAGIRDVLRPTVKASVKSC
jgi:magnesium-transporting ATPase (P-type)